MMDIYLLRNIFNFVYIISLRNTQSNMTEQSKIAQAKILLKKLPFLSQQDIEDLPKTKISLWIALAKLVRNNINYAFDEDLQLTFNKVFDQLDTILDTKKSINLKKKALQKLQSFPEILNKMINQFASQVKKLQESDTDMEQAQQKALQSTFELEIPRWTYKQLTEVIEKKLQKYERLRNESKLTEFHRVQLAACKKFMDEIGDEDIDFELVDRLIIQRIGQNLNDTLNLSIISNTPRSYETLDSSDSQQISDLQHRLEELELVESVKNEKRREVVSEVKRQQKNNIFLKKENRILDELENISIPKVEIRIEKKQEQKKEEPKCEPQKFLKRELQQPQLVNINSNRNNESSSQLLLPVFRTNHPSLINQNQQARTSPTTNTDTNESQQNSNQYEVSFTLINDTLFSAQDKQANERFSQQLIDRCSSQSRFTVGKYLHRREAQVREIQQSQLRPLLDLLMSFRHNTLDKYSPYYHPIKVEVYGSYENKAGFRKTSDININLTMSNVGNMHATMFNLRNLLDTHRKRGALNTMRLRSVMYAQQYQQVILSHQNNRTKPKTRQPNAVNYIYLTINRFDYTLSSQFMKQVIYSGKEKATDIANLTNFLHLCFKSNNILDYKDMYHTWWTDNIPQKIFEKSKSMRNYVNIPIYVMHMMVLYYLKEMIIISRITFQKQTNEYDFQLLNHDITLFQLFKGFLTFYSFNGGYVNDHLGITIDVVSNRAPDAEAKLIKLLLENEYKIKEYMFPIIHPRSEDLVKPEYGENVNKCLSYHIKIGSPQEKLFFEKIDTMLKVVKNLKPTDNFDPNELLEWSKLQHDY